MRKMHHSKNAFIMLFPLIVGGGLALAQPPTEDLVRTQLVADVSAVRPGQTFTLGVLFEMKPEWHIYWHNPGDSGLATSIRFDLPEGVKAGPLLWPAPMRFIQPGDILGYGYKGSVLLASRVFVPDDSDQGTSIAIRAQTRWLSCKDVCIPGTAELQWSLPVADTWEPANVPMFARWEETLPVEAFSMGVQASAAGKLPKDGSPGSFTITLKSESALSRVEWFPYADPAVRIMDATVRATAQTAEIRFKAALLRGREITANELQSVVTYTDPQGTRRAIRVSVPLHVTEGSIRDFDRRIPEDPRGGRRR